MHSSIKTISVDDQVPPKAADEMLAQPDTSFLTASLGLKYPVIGFYDAPVLEDFPEVIEKRGCLFSTFDQWQNGKMTHISRARPGCLGTAHWLCSAQPMPPDDFLNFLVNTEGLKPNCSLMEQFLDLNTPYRMLHRHLVIGPLVPAQYSYCRTVTIYCDPDQLAALLIGVFHDHQPGTPTRLLPSFGPGCFQIAGIFPNLDGDYAIISSMDIAMRAHLPRDILSLTVTRSLFEKLCILDGNSFFAKHFWKRLVQKRAGPGKSEQ